MKRDRLIVRLILFAVGIAVVFGAFQCYKTECVKYQLFSPQNIKEYILGFGSWALLVYIILYAVNTISLLPPIGAMSLAAGFIFGPLLGTIGIMTGSLVGTSATFFISRIFGRGLVDKVVKGRFKDFEDRLNRNGFVAILFIRLVPIIPWEVVNYASGLSKIKYRDFITATVLGILPSVVIQTIFADRLSDFNWRDPKLLAAVTAFIILIFVPGIYITIKKKLKK